MDDNQRKYDDFFRYSSKKDQETSERERDSRPNQPEDDESAYYSYGTDLGSSYSSGQVEVTPPKPVRPYSISSTSGNAPRSWEYRDQRPKTSFKSIFAAFVAGAVLVSSLMFVSDRLNLFSDSTNAAGAQVSPSAGSGTGAAVTTSFNGGSGVTTANATMRPMNIADIVSGASPAVVKIETFVKSNRVRSNMNEDFFRYFFGDDFFSAPQDNGSNNGRRTAGLGTGFIFDKSGYILTNQHVIEGADEIEVLVEGHKEAFKAELLGTAPDLDLAVVKITGKDDFATLPFGSSDQMRVGDWVTAIGNPMGFDHTVSVGVLSAKEREIKIPDGNKTRVYQHLLQTDASINPGNSGGPLLNLNGEVIGINTAVSSQAQGIGFAIPTSTVMTVLDNLKNNVKIQKPFVGVSMQDIEEAWVKELKLENTDGVLVRSVVRNSPADKAGLQPYDVIVDINGTKIKNVQEFTAKVQTFKVGDKITMVVIRDGLKMNTGLTIGDMNDY
jgi:serine protease Do